MTPSPAALTIYAFGTTALLAGILGLLNPSDAPEAWRPVEAGNCLGATAMGLYYTLAAYQENRAFFALTVPMRLLTTGVFWYHGWKGVAAWEGGGAALTGITLLVCGAQDGARRDRKD